MSSTKAYLEWIGREYFQVFFYGDIAPENIKDLSGVGDVKKSLPTEGVQAMECMIDNYISILQERRKYFTAEELDRATEIDKILRMNGKVQEFRDRVMRGDKEALAQIEDVLNQM